MEFSSSFTTVFSELVWIYDCVEKSFNLTNKFLENFLIVIYMHNSRRALARASRWNFKVHETVTKLERLEWEGIKHRQSSKRVLIFHPVSVLFGRWKKVSFSSSEAIHGRTMEKREGPAFQRKFELKFLSFYEAWNFCVIKKSRKKAPTKATVEHGRVSFICPE